MQIVRPSDDLSKLDRNKQIIFLAGGMKKPWREELVDKVKEMNLDVIILDPTTDWKEMGEETVENEKYVEQTNWEHDGLQRADIHIFHFDDTSLSPITLFELGMFVDRDSIIYLEEDYEKKSYVDYIALRFGVPIVKSLKELAGLLSIRFHSRKRH